MYVLLRFFFAKSNYFFHLSKIIQHQPKNTQGYGFILEKVRGEFYKENLKINLLLEIKKELFDFY